MPNANASSIEPHDAPAGAGVEERHVRVRVRVRRAAIFVSALGAITYLLASAGVPCGFARIVHMPCPGCGSTRAMLALATGDLHGLVRYNPLAPFMTLLVVALALQALASVLATGTFRRVGEGAVGMLVSRGVMLVAALEVLVWIARFGGFLGGPVPV